MPRPGEGAQEPAHGLGLLLKELGRGHHGVAVEVEPVFGVEERDDVLLGDAGRLEVEDRGEEMGADRVYLPFDEERLPQRGVHAHPGDLRRVQAHRLGEHREQPPGGVARRRTELSSLQFLGIRDVAALQGHDGERGVVKDHADGDERLVGVASVELDHRVDVGIAQVIGAARDLAHRVRGPVPSVNRDIQAFLSEVPLVEGHQERRLWPLEHPVEREFELRHGLGKPDHAQCHHKKPAQHATTHRTPPY